MEVAEAYMSPRELIVSQVRHLIYDGFLCDDYSDLYNLSCECPDLEKLELKKEMQGALYEQEGRLKFRKLKELNLKYHDHIQSEMKHLKAIIKDTNTKLNLGVSI